MPMALTPATLPSLPACTSGLMGSSFNQLTEKEKTQTWFVKAAAGYTGASESRQL